VSQLVAAGIGLCALELGDLAEAKRRESEVSTLPRDWRADPYILLLFATRLLERRGRHAEAYQLARTTAEHLRWRFPPAWLKVLPLQARLGRRTKALDWPARIAEGAALANELSFHERAAELRALVP